MPKEYRTIQEVAGPLMLVKGVENVTYDELAEIELANGEKRRCKVLEINEGNALVQLMALGEISDLAAARAIVKANVKTKLYASNDDSPLNEKFTLFQQLTEDK